MKERVQIDPLNSRCSFNLLETIFEFIVQGWSPKVRCTFNSEEKLNTSRY